MLFGFKLPLEVQAQLAAEWLRGAAERRALIRNRGDFACFDDDEILNVIRQPRYDWYLVDRNSISAECTPAAQFKTLKPNYYNG